MSLNSNLRFISVELGICMAIFYAGTCAVFWYEQAALLWNYSSGDAGRDDHVCVAWCSIWFVDGFEGMPVAAFYGLLTSVSWRTCCLRASTGAVIRLARECYTDVSGARKTKIAAGSMMLKLQVNSCRRESDRRPRQLGAPDELEDYTGGAYGRRAPESVKMVSQTRYRCIASDMSPRTRRTSSRSSPPDGRRLQVLRPDTAIHCARHARCTARDPRQSQG